MHFYFAGAAYNDRYFPRASLAFSFLQTFLHYVSFQETFRQKVSNYVLVIARVQHAIYCTGTI